MGVPFWGSVPGGGNGNPLQCSCLGNPMDRGAWQVTVHRVARVKHDLVTEHAHMHLIFIRSSYLCSAISVHILLVNFIWE